MYLFESILWRVALPAILATVSLPIAATFGASPSWGSEATLFIIWLIIINGGFLFFDGDDNLNWFD